MMLDTPVPKSGSSIARETTARLALAVVLTALLLSACGHGEAVRSSRSPAGATPSAVRPSLPPAPPDDPSLSHEDRAGREPGDVIMALIDAKQDRAWRRAYALYADPWTSFETAAQEWSAADETYEDFIVLETRVVGEGKGKGSAFVRVAYSGETTPPGGERYAFERKPPGTWMIVVKQDGLWKVNWSQ
jgi:hypothetical protein